MLSLFAVLAFLSAAALLAGYLIRQARKPVNTDHAQHLPPVDARPLFAPSPSDVKAYERELEEKTAAVVRTERDRKLAERTAVIEGLIVEIASVPTRQNALKLIELAADHGVAALFSRAAGEIIKVFREGRLHGLTADDVAALLDSHYRLLPAGERSSGELFWLKEEIAAVRLVG